MGHNAARRMPAPPCPAAVTVLIADDHAILRQGIIAVLSRHPQIQVLGEAANGHEAVALFDKLRPDVAILDLKMPEMGGVEAMQAILARHPQARLLALTTYSGDVLMRKAFEAGASGYLLKQSIRTELPEAIEALHGGRKYIPSEVASVIAQFITADMLSAREIEVLGLVAKGGSNRAIGATLRISEETVKTHLKSIFAKIGATDRTQAVIIAMRRGMLDPQRWS